MGRGFQVGQVLGHAVRSLWRAPGTAVPAVLTLGLALTATVGLLAILDMGLRELPVPEGDEVVRVEVLDARGEPVPGAEAEWERWLAGPGLESGGAVRRYTADLYHATAPAQRASGAAVTPAALGLLGVRPVAGRLPTADPSDRAAVVLGWELWRAMGGSGLLGTTLEVDGRPHTIIGVMPEGFGFPLQESFWTVLPRGGVVGELVGRLSEGTTESAAGSALTGRLRDLALVEGAARPLRARVRSWTAGRGEGGEAAAFAGLSGLVLLLLLVCAVNVATLLVVRSTERSGVMALEAALGASRSRVAGQVLAEAALVSVGGGLLGLLGGALVLRWLESTAGEHWGYFWMELEVRPLVVAGTFGAVVVASVLAGAAPALHALRTDLRSVIGGGGRGTRRPRRMARWFIGAQVALSTVGLIAAAYLGLGLVRSSRALAGLPADRVAVAATTLPEHRYDDAASRADFLNRTRAELGRIPGARAAGLSTGVPGFDYGAAPLHLPGDAFDAGAGAPTAYWLAADAGFLDVYGLELVAGERITGMEASPVALVTLSFARRFLDGGAVGRRVRLAGVHGEEEWAEVVGVVDDWYREDASRPDRVILPLHQADPRRVFISLATDGRAETLLPGLRQAVRTVDPELPLEAPGTLADRLAWLTRIPRLFSSFGALGGVVALLVAAIGLYGVMAFHVRSRLPEIGVRMAMGADRRRVAREVLGESIRRVLPGLLVGLVLGGAVGPVVRASVVGTRSVSPALLAAVLLTILATGVVAALAPALRAARVEPLDVLRGE